MQLLSKYRQLEFYFLVLFKLTRTKKKHSVRMEIKTETQLGILICEIHVATKTTYFYLKLEKYF